jgi:N-acetylmuramoyl-L-alanine amidase
MGRTEKSLTLDLAKRVASRLEARGLSVVMTRTTDRTLELSDRTDFARRKQGDLFVSIHFNSAFNSVSGIETYSLTPVGAASTSGGLEGRESYPGNRQDDENLWLVHCVHKSLLRVTGAEDRGARRARFQVLREAPCPAILVEAGFLSSASEERKILTTEYRDLLAKAIADGILTYKKSRE